MAYTDDAVLAKLSALSESHDSIATAAQWIMFHRRRADRTVQLWVQRLKESSSGKRLNLVYLANEVTQQSKARHKDEFVLAFSPIIAEATSIAYKGATAEIQGKLRRVIDVWRDRAIFEAPIQEAIEARIDELDKVRGAPRTGFGTSSFHPTPTQAELARVTTLLPEIAKTILANKSAISTSQQEFDKLIDPSSPVPSAPVYAARLNGLVKTLVGAENLVSESVKLRREVVNLLRNLFESHQAVLGDEEESLAKISTQRLEIEMKKQEVEMAIIRGLGPNEHEAPTTVTSVAPVVEPDRPEMEALTPPAISENGDDLPTIPLYPQPFLDEHLSPLTDEPYSGVDNHTSVTVAWPNKRRRLEEEEEILDLGGDIGIDADVVEMLQGGMNGQ